MQLNILFESESFVAIDKPGGVLSVPARASDDSRPVAGIILQEQLGKRIFPVHRLDFEVSGVMIFALSAAAHRAANQWFEKQEVQKTYEAWTEVDEGGRHTMYKDETIWESLLVRGKKRAFEADYGKLSKTRAQWIGERTWNTDPVLTWKVQPLTGRSHQIRYELKIHGFAILGDSLYGAVSTFAPQEIALRAVSISFPISANKTFGLPLMLSGKNLEAIVK